MFHTGLVIVLLASCGQVGQNPDSAARQRYIDRRVSEVHAAMDRIGLPHDFLPRTRANNSGDDPVFLFVALRALAKEDSATREGLFSGGSMTLQIIDGNLYGLPQFAQYHNPDPEFPITSQLIPPDDWDQEAILQALWNKNHLHLAQLAAAAAAAATPLSKLDLAFIDEATGRVNFSKVADVLIQRIKTVHGLEAHVMPFSDKWRPLIPGEEISDAEPPPRRRSQSGGLLGGAVISDAEPPPPDDPREARIRRGTRIQTMWLSAPSGSREWMRKQMVWRIVHEIDIVLEGPQYAVLFKRTTDGPARLSVSTRIQVGYSPKPREKFKRLPKN